MKKTFLLLLILNCLNLLAQNETLQTAQTKFQLIYEMQVGKNFNKNNIEVTEENFYKDLITKKCFKGIYDDKKGVYFTTIYEKNSGENHWISIFINNINNLTNINSYSFSNAYNVSDIIDIYKNETGEKAISINIVEKDSNGLNNSPAKSSSYIIVEGKSKKLYLKRFTLETIATLEN